MLIRVGIIRYLFIEGKTQDSIDRAKMEITRILKEEIHREKTTYTGRANPGRYNVLSLTSGGSGPSGRNLALTQ